MTRASGISGLCLALALIVVGWALPAAAQLTGANKPIGGDETKTISVQVRLVVEAVSVKDKNGKPIDGLSAKDFTITEDGVAQTIKFCEHQTLPEVAAALPPTPPGGEDIKIYNRLGRTQIASETPGEIRYKDHRLLALYFDMSGMGPTDQLRALIAAQKFVRQNMTAADLVSIMRYAGGSMDVLQDFTADRNRILSILETMVVGEGQGNDESTSDDSSSDTGAAFGQDDPEFNIFTTDRQLSALQTAAETLSRLNEKKELVYFASGLNLNGIDNQAQLHATVDAAIRAGVSFWPVDARGLVATGPLGNATQGSQGGSSMYTGGAATALTTRFELSQDTLFALAGDTGGKALLDNNDLEQGIINAQKAESNYYILGYYTSNTAKNGKFRKIKVTVGPPQEDAKLDFRAGYYADKEWGKFNAADKDRQLEDALMQQDPWVDLTVALELNFFQLNRAEYYVPFTVKIPGSELVLAKKRGADIAAIDFVGEIKDDYGGTTQTNIREHAEFKVSDKTAEELSKRPIEYSGGYTAAAGQVHHQGAGAGRRYGQGRDLRDVVPGPEPEQGDQARRHQFRRAVRRAEAVLGCELQRQQGQGAGEGDRGRSPGAERPEAVAECDPGVQQGQEPLRLPAGVRGHRNTLAAGRLCHSLPGADQGAGEPAAGGVAAGEYAAGDGAAELHCRPEYPAAG